mgnify:FL=1
MSDGQLPITFLELDQRWQARKGTAFRAFKRALPELREGVDFRCLQSRRHAAEIAALRAAGRLYASSVNAVLLSPTGVARLKRP